MLSLKETAPITDHLDTLNELVVSLPQLYGDTLSQSPSGQALQLRSDEMAPGTYFRIELPADSSKSPQLSEVIDWGRSGGAVTTYLRDGNELRASTRPLEGDEDSKTITRQLNPSGVRHLIQLLESAQPIASLQEDSTRPDRKQQTAGLIQRVLARRRR